MPLDDRLRDDLRAEADSLLPDTDHHLRMVMSRARVGTGATSWLVVATATAVVLAVLVLGILPGARESGPGGSDAPTPDATAIPPLGLDDTGWSVTLLATDPGVAELGMAGRWILRLRDRSVLDVDPPNTFATSAGTEPRTSIWALDGTTFLTNLFSSDFGANCAGPGVYTVIEEGHQLGFTGQDTCEVRRALLTTRPWTAAR